MAPPRARLPQVVTASAWSTVVQQVWAATAGKPTNAEAVAILMGLLAELGSARVPLWYQYAAAAYDWAPGRDLDVTQAQSTRPYPLASELWSWLRDVAARADTERVPTPRLDLDATWRDLVTQGTVKRALDEDAGAQWKIPLPACKDPKTGKPRFPVIGPDGKLTCDVVTVDDPITVVKSSALDVLLWLGVGYLGWKLLSNER